MEEVDPLKEDFPRQYPSLDARNIWNYDMISLSDEADEARVISADANLR
jgi:hypothetical protein